MAQKVFMTALSPTMEEGTIAKWNKQPGDSYASGDVICEVETDKATMDYEAPEDGTLLHIVLGEGATAKVGDVIGISGEKGEDFAELLKEIEAEAAAPKAEPSAKKEEAAPEPVTAEPAAPSEASAPAVPATPPSAGFADGSIVASPLARKIASDRGLDLRSVQGTGPGGRIVKRDVETAEVRPVAMTPMAGGAGVGAGPVAAPGQDLEIPTKGVRGAIARKVTETMFSAPHFYIKNTVAMDNLIAARGMLNKEAPSKVSFNAFLIKMAAEALKKHPGVNSTWKGDHILQFGSIDIALAVDLGNGLMMPIVRNAGNKGIVQIDAELKELIEKVRQGTLTSAEFTGATFSISNLGSFGVDEFTAILNEPGAAILALGKVTKRPVYDDKGNLVPQNQMTMTLSADHRVIDGSMGGRFLSELRNMIENPVRVLF